MVFKTIILLSAYIFPFTWSLFLHLPMAVNFVLWALMGIALADIGMGIMTMPIMAHIRPTAE
jgi:hypothetical protein